MKIRLISLAMAVGTISLNALAEEGIDSSVVREWVRQGRIHSVEQIAEMNQARISAKILDVEVEEKKGMIVYEFQVMNTDGDVRELYFDAATGEFIKEEGKD